MMKILSAVLLCTVASAFTPVIRRIPGSTRLYDTDASWTSAYTSTETCRVKDVLQQHCTDKSVKQVVMDMLDVCAEITEALRAVKDMDDIPVNMIADQLMWDAVKASSVVCEGASKENPLVVDVDTSGDGVFTVCWDPLDDKKSSTMAGVWPTANLAAAGATGRDQVTSFLAFYGPRTTALVALDDGTYEFTYGCTPDGCMLADGKWEPWVCTGKQVSVIDKMLPKKNSFLAFEAAPFGLLVEKAGGKSSVLDVPIESLDQRNVDQKPVPFFLK